MIRPPAPTLSSSITATDGASPCATLALSALTLVVACVRGPSRGASATAPIRRAAGVVAEAPRAPCERARDATRRAIADAPRPPPDEPVDEFLASARDLPPYRFCHETPHGSWALELSDLTRRADEGHDLVGQWSLVFTAPDGARRAVRPEADPRAVALRAGYNLVPGTFQGIVPDVSAAGDLDGDGVPEVVSVSVGYQNEGPTYRRVQVWTVRDGRIAPYPPAAAIEADGVEDRDGDGRPDLLTRLGYSERTSLGGSGFEAVFVGPQFVAHATTTGTFSTDDDAARTDLLRRCGPPRASVVVRGHAGTVDCNATAEAIICARVFGGSATPILNELRVACAPSRPAPADDESPCDQGEILEAWARREPPVRFSR